MIRQMAAVFTEETKNGLEAHAGHQPYPPQL
jgi:hypothetical protein